jgi:hypothetical protein
MKFSKPAWAMVEAILNSIVVRTFYLWGPPGGGKTWAAYHIGVKEAGFYAITLTDETSAAELRGHWIFKGGDAVWHDGPFVSAMREGKRLVINEITNASADVLALLHPILEDISTARLTLPTKETIVPSDGFHVIATDNRPPALLPDPLRDRFDCNLEVKETNPAAYLALPEDLRDVARTEIGDGDRRISARGWMALARLREEFGLGDSCRMVFGLERGRMIHDALVLAMDPSEATEPDPPKKRSEPSDSETVELVGFRNWVDGRDRPVSDGWGPLQTCTCDECKEFNEYLQAEGIDPNTVEV